MEYACKYWYKLSYQTNRLVCLNMEFVTDINENEKLGVSCLALFLLP